MKPANIAKVATVVAILVVLAAVTCVVTLPKITATLASGRTAPPESAPSLAQLQAANVGLPELQTQAKQLIYAAMVQRRIPPSTTWCDVLNADRKVWATTPTNTVFAMNARMAGQAYSRSAPGDVVVFFQAARAGWNVAGGPELLASRPEGVAVALLDGRALIVSHEEASQLRWAP